MDRPPITRTDIAVAAAVAAVLVLEVLGETDNTIRGPVLLAYLLAILMGGCLAFRRRYPFTVYAFNGVTLALQATFFFTAGTYPFANAIAIYAVGEYGDRRRSWIALPIAGVGIWSYFRQADEPGALPYLVIMLWIATWTVGRQVEGRRREAAALATARASTAVAEERTRLARDLHDQVGHAVTVMIVQAGAARSVLSSDPARAREALASIEDLGRRTMVDLDRMLGILRRDDTADGGQELSLLLDDVRDAGLDVTFVRGPDVDLRDDDLGHVVHRLVQEALTNVLRHASASHADVSLVTHHGALQVIVEDDGVGPSTTTRPGRGLTGMSERVARLGGSMDHGRGQGGGFIVCASIPLTPCDDRDDR